MNRGSRLRMLAVTLAAAAALHGVAAAASIEEREAEIARSLRCPVCQNQSLAESNAPLAASMRQQIRDQLGQGRSEQQIRAYFEQRYGAFIRYDPPFTLSTWLLWLGPFALLALGLGAMWRLVSRRSRTELEPLTPEQQARAASLLEGNAP
jgi:cytochrome c-type biogenesis protein CcmH